MTCRTAATPACSSRLAASRQSLSRHGAAISARPAADGRLRRCRARRARRRRQAQAGDRLRQQAHAGAGRQALAGQHQVLGADGRGGHRRGGRDQHVVAREQRQRVAVDAMAYPLGLLPRRRAPGCPPPGGRANTARSSRNASPGGADAARRPRRDHERGGARLLRAGQFDDIGRRARPVARPRAPRAGPVGEIAAQHGHAQGTVRGQRRQRGFDGPLGAGPIPASGPCSAS